METEPKRSKFEGRIYDLVVQALMTAGVEKKDDPKVLARIREAMRLLAASIIMDRHADPAEKSEAEAWMLKLTQPKNQEAKS